MAWIVVPTEDVPKLSLPGESQIWKFKYRERFWVCTQTTSNREHERRVDDYCSSYLVPSNWVILLCLVDNRAKAVRWMTIIRCSDWVWRLSVGDVVKEMNTLYIKLNVHQDTIHRKCIQLCWVWTNVSRWKWHWNRTGHQGNGYGGRRGVGRVL